MTCLHEFGASTKLCVLAVFLLFSLSFPHDNGIEIISLFTINQKVTPFVILCYHHHAGSCCLRVIRKRSGNQMHTCRSIMLQTTNCTVQNIAFFSLSKPFYLPLCCRCPVTGICQYKQRAEMINVQNARQAENHPQQVGKFRRKLVMEWRHRWGEGIT